MCMYAGDSAMQARTASPLVDCEVVVEGRDERQIMILLSSSNPAIALRVGRAREHHRRVSGQESCSHGDLW